jgi:hypothetical protein
MDSITMEDVRNIFSDRHSGWCTSLFMPTHRAGREKEQNTIRFKNLLRQVEERLLDKGLRSPQVRDMLTGPQRLLQDPGFWQRQSDGLAVFFSDDTYQCFRLPLDFEELVVISTRFHVKPLLSMLTSDGTFYVLTLSQNQVRLLKGTRHTVDEVDIQEKLQRISEALPDAFPEKQLQFHTGTPSSGSGGRPAMFYGHDISNDVKNNILRWFRMIDKELRDLFSGEQAPLVLAGVDYLFPIYREANTYPHLLDAGVGGNPDGLKPDALHGQAWGLVEPVFREARETAVAKYRQLAGTGHTTTGVKDAVLAAHHGRIEVLFVAVGVQEWGQFDPDAEEIHVHGSPEPGDGDLLDLTAIQTLIKGGTVYAVAPEEVPDQAPLAAILRY